ncbi:MAG: acyl-ACP--UDP-N-acetylglucosamine O-acyltransferase [Alphaproteobacteria bacterium]|nr:acyl-ACP--UDP-N-acetylglucosamine O-acyltransferase [Alphaproteobacteria bacterium]
MSQTFIHPTAVIEDGAQIGEGSHIGPYCVIGAEVKLGKNVRLHSHVAIAGDTEIGEGTQVFPFASLGHAPQDLKFKGEKTRLVIGKHNTIREHVTMNPGTEGGGALTQVGDNCLFMMATHIAHDCIVGNHVIMANNATLAGHVHVGDGAVIGGLAAVHQFVRIGTGAMIGGLSGVENDVIPFGTVIGERAWLAGLNLIGLKRRQLDRDSIHAIRHTFKDVFGITTGTVASRAAEARAKYGHVPAVDNLLSFIETKSRRSILVPRDASAIIDDSEQA